MRLCKITFRRGRTSPGPRSRVGLPLPAAWEVLGLGEFLWWQEQVCEVIEQTCDGMLTVACVLGGGTGTGQRALAGFSVRRARVASENDDEAVAMDPGTAARADMAQKLRRCTREGKLSACGDGGTHGYS